MSWTRARFEMDWIALAVALVAGCSCSSEVRGGADGSTDANAASDAMDGGPDRRDGETDALDAWVTDGSSRDDAPPDATPDAGACVPDVMGSGGLTMCETNCQTWARARLPGWDVAAWCLLDENEPHAPWSVCIRADSCVLSHPGGPSFMCFPDAGRICTLPRDCTCGGGPACGPGYQCARPMDDPTAPRTCVCSNAAP